ncbi:MAG: pyridoxal phosphate-dependent aminotransferase, partial [Eubacteriales bacterium]
MQFSKKALAITPSPTLKITAMEKEMLSNGKDVIGFGAGEPDMDTPDYIKLAAKEALDRGITKYTPASGTLDLKKAVAARLNRKYGLVYEPAQIVISNGAKHSLFNAFQAILNPGDEVIIISPYWVTYPELVKMADGEPVYVEAAENNNFEPKLEDIEAAITTRTAAIIVNSPSNPCGCVYSRKTLEGIAELARKHDLYVISDEIYDELTYDNTTHYSFPALSGDAYSRTILVNGLSKAYSMTGWRMGYTACSKELAKIMDSYQSHATSNASSITQYASVVALNGPQDDLVAMVREFGLRRDMMVELIGCMKNVCCIKPEGAFYVMLDITGVIGRKCGDTIITGSLAFTQCLLEESLVAVVPGVAFGADNFVRLSYATSREN